MDNRSRFYKARYEKAEDLAHRGRVGEALDICWSLRLEPELGLYSRACVNLLISSIIDVNQYRDADKYAAECLVLLHELEIRYPVQYQASIDEVTKIKANAEQNPEWIKTTLSKGEKEGVTRGKEEKEEGGEKNLQPWRLEGAFTLSKQENLISAGQSETSSSSNLLGPLPILPTRKEKEALQLETHQTTSPGQQSPDGDVGMSG